MIGSIAAGMPVLARPMQFLRAALWGLRGGHSALSRASYARWIRAVDTPSRQDVRELRARCMAFAARPTISVLLPVRNPAPALLDAAIKSVREQLYPHWELCIAQDAAADPSVTSLLQRHADADLRIKVLAGAHGAGMAAASNAALGMAVGEYVAALDEEDQLPPVALYWIADAINRNPDACILYSDEDRVDTQGVRLEPHFKCDFNHVLLLAKDAISRLCVYRRDLVMALGGFRPGFEGAHDYDLTLRCVSAVAPPSVVHVPRILYHRRERAAGVECSRASAAVPAAQRAVAEHVRALDIGASIEPAPESPGHFRICHSLPSPPPLVSIVICTRDRAPLLRTAVESIVGKTTYPRWEIVVIDNGSRDPDACSYLSALSGRTGFTVIRDDSAFNYSQLNNAAVRKSRGQVLCLLNNDVEVLTPGWLEEMVSFAVQPGIGAVGARLWYPDGTLQHGGVILGVGGIAGHAHADLARGDRGYFSRAVLQQELTAVTGACLVVRRHVFDEAGGLDEQLAEAFNDVDLCLRIRTAGYRNVWTPYAELIHLESASRGLWDSAERRQRFQREIQLMRERWGKAIDADPHYNVSLSLRAGDYALAPPRRSRSPRPCA